MPTKTPRPAKTSIPTPSQPPEALPTLSPTPRPWMTATPPTATPEPSVTPKPVPPSEFSVDLSGVQPLYGEGTVKYDSSAKSITAEGVSGLLIPLGAKYTVGEKVKVKVSGTADIGFRMWMSAESSGRYSEIQNPAEFDMEYIFTIEDLENRGEVSSCLCLKAPYGLKIENIKINTVELLE